MLNKTDSIRLVWLYYKYNVLYKTKSWLKVVNTLTDNNYYIILKFVMNELKYSDIIITRDILINHWSILKLNYFWHQNVTISANQAKYSFWFVLESWQCNCLSFFVTIIIMSNGTNLVFVLYQYFWTILENLLYKSQFIIIIIIINQDTWIEEKLRVS